MNEAETSVRESLINTLSFLASESKQLEFAAKIFYRSYQDEFACWWFDTFFPAEPSALHMFSPAQLAVLKNFSDAFNASTEKLGIQSLTIEELQRSPEWRSVIANAQAACTAFAHAT